MKFFIFLVALFLFSNAHKVIFKTNVDKSEVDTQHMLKSTVFTEANPGFSNPFYLNFLDSFVDQVRQPFKRMLTIDGLLPFLDHDVDAPKEKDLTNGQNWLDYWTGYLVYRTAPTIVIFLISLFSLLLAPFITCCCWCKRCCCFKHNTKVYTDNQIRIPIVIYYILSALAIVLLIFCGIAGHSFILGVRNSVDNTVKPLNSIESKVATINDIFDNAFYRDNIFEKFELRANEEVFNSSKFARDLTVDYRTNLTEISSDSQNFYEIGNSISLKVFDKSVVLPNISQDCLSVKNNIQTQVDNVLLYISKLENINLNLSSQISDESILFQDNLQSKRNLAVGYYDANLAPYLEQVKSFKKNYFDTSLIQTHVFIIFVCCILIAPIILISIGLKRKTYKYYLIAIFLGLFFIFFLMLFSVVLFPSSFLANDFCSILSNDNSEILLTKIFTEDEKLYFQNCRNGISFVDGYGYDTNISNYFNINDLSDPLKAKAKQNINLTEISNLKTQLISQIQFNSQTEFYKLPLSSLNISGITNTSTVNDIGAVATTDLNSLNSALLYCTNCGIYNGKNVSQNGVQSMDISVISNSSVLSLLSSANKSINAYVELNNLNITLLQMEYITDGLKILSTNLMDSLNATDQKIEQTIDMKTQDFLLLLSSSFDPTVSQIKETTKCKDITDSLELAYANSCLAVSPSMGVYGFIGSIAALLLLISYFVVVCFVIPRQKIKTFESFEDESSLVSENEKSKNVEMQQPKEKKKEKMTKEEEEYFNTLNERQKMKYIMDREKKYQKENEQILRERENKKREEREKNATTEQNSTKNQKERKKEKEEVTSAYKYPYPHPVVNQNPPQYQHIPNIESYKPAYLEMNQNLNMDQQQQANQKQANLPPAYFPPQNPNPNPVPVLANNQVAANSNQNQVNLPPPAYYPPVAQNPNPNPNPNASPISNSNQKQANLQPPPFSSAEFSSAYEDFFDILEQRK